MLRLLSGDGRRDLGFSQKLVGVLVRAFAPVLPEAARLLGQSQHRLIYLCEKGVVPPDVADARGRGSSRRFSDRNLLEFAIALKLRDLTIPVAAIAGIVYTLRLFSSVLAGRIKDFSIVQSLKERDAPDLRIIVADGDRLYFSLGKKGAAPKLYGGIEFRQLLTAEKKGAPAVKSELLKPSKLMSTSSDFGGPEGSRYARIELSVTQVAKDLPLVE